MAHDLRHLTRPQITPELMLRAYASGIFPMSEARDDPDIFWVDPQRRGIMPLDGFHISRSLRKTLRSGAFEVHVNRDFAGVLRGCANREETWINDEISTLYMALHVSGQAHSVEVSLSGSLVGGVYGVALGAAFFGESMFSTVSDASKVALAHLVARLRLGGFELFDTQFLTSHLASLGGIEVTRAEYHTRLRQALRAEGDFLSPPEEIPFHDVLHLSTQTS
ncbi:MAG: leucyl/phenylalanyl-tRNA--protein transferase [Pseudomonadota bacterium]